MADIVFLGTGGGRFVTISQTRATGGIYIEEKGVAVHIDPGPGALVHMCGQGIDPRQLDGVFVSHCHPDHYNDAEILVEAMTHGGTRKRGVLAGSVSVLMGVGEFSPAVSPYHQKKPGRVEVMNPGDSVEIGHLRVVATPAVHSDPTAIGFVIETRGGRISYSGDTVLREEVVKAHRGSDLLILNVTRPLGMEIPHHMSTGDALEFVKTVEPEMAVLTHFGGKFTEHLAEKEALFVERHSGVNTIAARDFMRISL